jgi:tripeptide aminopeptidase
VNPSETALSIFLQRQIPAITMGLTSGDNFHQEGAMIEIEPMFQRHISNTGTDHGH